LKTFFGLSFLDPEEVEECFVFDIFSEAPESEKAIKFADYVVNNYINKSSTFPPITWADSDVECKRTTNGCESFHKEFSTMFYCSHPCQTQNTPQLLLGLRSSSRKMFSTSPKSCLYHVC
jgi:hypothetical protein